MHSVKRFPRALTAVQASISAFRAGEVPKPRRCCLWEYLGLVTVLRCRMTQLSGCQPLKEFIKAMVGSWNLNHQMYKWDVAWSKEFTSMSSAIFFWNIFFGVLVFIFSPDTVVLTVGWFPSQCFFALATQKNDPVALKCKPRKTKQLKAHILVQTQLCLKSSEDHVMFGPSSWFWTEVLGET